MGVGLLSVSVIYQTVPYDVGQNKLNKYGQEVRKNSHNLAYIIHGK